MSNPTRLEQLRLDVVELQRLLGEAERPRVKDVLGLEIRKAETEILALESSMDSTAAQQQQQQHFTKLLATAKTPTCYDVKVTNYAWDQSEKYVKVYMSLKNVQNLPKDEVTCHFTPKSMDLLVKNLEGKNYILRINDLMHAIVPDQSHFKAKNDTVIVYLKKESTKHWSYLTEYDRKAKEPKTPKMDEGGDPENKLMDMMRQMYEDGDDEMKRTIAKAWTESRDKSKGQIGF